MWGLLALLACGEAVKPEADEPATSSEPAGDSGSGGSGGSTTPGGDDSATTDDSDTTEPGEPVASTRADLRLKRWRQISLDLEGALSLTADQICLEAGVYDCADLNGVPLGGVSVENGVFEHPNTLQATTSLATERMALQACYNRLQLDLAGEPVVFTALDLAAPSPTDAEAEAQITLLSRRFLARDPLLEEVNALAGLRAAVEKEGGTSADWAVLVCFALATSTEALTY